MTLPLYREAREAARQIRQAGSGAGQATLHTYLYDEYAVTTGSWSFKKGDTNRKWLESLCDRGPCGNRDRLQAHSLRVHALVSAAGGSIRVFKARGSLVTGLGRPNALENGFAWHPTLGTPYLCGAAVKGMVRAFAQEWADDDDASDAAKLRDIFGDTEGGGDLMFFDAVPPMPVRLGVDVINPHAGEWVLKGGSANVPADWNVPEPHHFLVCQEVSLLFGIASRSGDSAKVERAFEWLGLALKYLGAGAKTAVGLGRMSPDAAADEKVQSLAQAEGVKVLKAGAQSPQERMRIHLETLRPGQLADALAQGRNNGLGDGDQHVLAVELRAIVQSSERLMTLVEAWAASDKKNEKRAYIFITRPAQ
ncbi:MAG: type III-B CRISPR module RAMP protein Cmr6 [Burkholderiales bacterium]